MTPAAKERAKRWHSRNRPHLRNYLRKWRATNKEGHHRELQGHRDYTAVQKEYIKQCKSVPCADCGIKYPPYVMDFDHVRGEKRYHIGGRTSMSLDNLAEEIAKCDVVCSNCHRERTFKRRLR